MSENTTTGPAGGNKPAMPAKKPDNYGTDRSNGGKDSGRGPAPSRGLPSKTGSPVNNG